MIVHSHLQKGRNKYMKNSNVISTISKVDSSGKTEPELFRYQAFPIPPPPPPPVIGSRMAPYVLCAPKQRTAQQKIYEYKHRKSFGYY